MTLINPTGCLIVVFLHVNGLNLGTATVKPDVQKALFGQREADNSCELSHLSSVCLQDCC